MNRNHTSFGVGVDEYLFAETIGVGTGETRVGNWDGWPEISDDADAGACSV